MITFDYNEATGCISALNRNDAGNHRESLIPGEFDRAREILPYNLYAELESRWTPEVISAHQARSAESLD